jgi:hypothetical protein
MGLIVKEFGGAWASERLLPPAFSTYDTNTNYLRRMTCLLVVASCAPYCDAIVCEKTLLPLTSGACMDKVANVRMQAAHSMGVLCSRLDKAVIARDCEPILARMVRDSDKDVSFAASQALKQC